MNFMPPILFFSEKEKSEDIKIYQSSKHPTHPTHPTLTIRKNNNNGLPYQIW
jgi:hypothetical protein